MPAARNSSNALPTEDFEFTPRQREVLDLLAAGRTNAQVADVLGVSLDGAKWHVREILSILGVEGREDAAEYWRRHNGVPSRFRRTWRSFTTAGLALRVAAGLGAAIAVAGAVLALLFLFGGGEDAEPAEPILPTPTPVLASVTATVTVSTTPDASATVTPAIPATAFAVGSQGIIGYDTTVYYTAGCTRCGRPPVPELFRLTRTQDGQLERRDIFPFLADYNEGYVNDFAAEWDRGHFVAAVCVEKYCGGESEPTTQIPLDLLETHDGGVTWFNAGTIPVGNYLVGFVADRTKLDAAIDGQLLVSDPAPDFSSTSYYYWPSGDIVAPPDAGITVSPVVVENVGLFWKGLETPHGPGIFFDGDGKEFLSVAGSGVDLIGRLKNGGWVAKWNGSDGLYVGLFDGAAMQWAFRAPLDIFRVTGILPQTVDRNGTVSAAQLYGDVLLNDFYCFGVGGGNCNTNDRMFPVYPSLFDITAGEIHPIAQIVDEYPEFTGNYHPFLLHIDPNPRLRVVAEAGPGDCLNVRDGPSASAPVLACVPDGVLLLKRSDAPATADGTTWAPVWTPGYEQGWASAEFLR